MIAPADAVKQIANWLNQRSQTVNHRQLLLLCGEQSWGERIAEHIWCNFSSRTNNEVLRLWLGTRGSDEQHAALSNAKQWLGQELDLIIFNAHAHLDIDALLAVSGTLRHQGLIVLLCPARENWSSELDCIQRPSLGIEISHSYFAEWFNSVLADEATIASIEQKTAQVKLPISPVAAADKTQFDVAAPFKTQDQSDIAKNVLRQLASPHKVCVAITAPRGRGKSWLASWLIQQYIQRSQSVILISSRAKAAQTIFQQTDPMNAREHLQYAAPDDDISRLSEVDLVVIDEAASIPVPMLERICQAAPSCLLTTTTDGYEGTGQGFIQRLLPGIEPLYQSLSHYQLEQPVRWYRNDRLESILAQMTCQTLAKAVQPKKIDLSLTYTLRQIESPALLSSPQKLYALFTLLRDAHYQTKTADLVRLLDSPDHAIYIAENSTSLLGACVVIKEGNSQLAELASPISQGQRRPQGHLSLQLMAFHTASPEYCHLSAWRINRIVVLEQARQHGVASALLGFVEQQAKSKHVDVMSTLFGEKAYLNNFWEKNAYSRFYSGDRQNKASNSQNVLYTKVLNPALKQWFDHGGALTTLQQTRKLYDFIAGWRGLASIQEALLAFSDIATNTENLPILNHIAKQQRCELTELVSVFALEGKKQLAEKLRDELQIALTALETDD
ncbi:GNAT family N-acetyltransferase [Alteromonas flava]|uniref:GNAT family N-acetyltransferase n=1 Tax=Alteromonas flava TaxID=2048003 RepID=UPI000C28C124|nr:GNAT family N-acetyltransferase [Alteromonas flava]